MLGNGNCLLFASTYPHLLFASTNSRHAVQVLNVNDTSLGNEGAMAVAVAVAQSHSVLEELEMSLNEITSQVMKERKIDHTTGNEKKKMITSQVKVQCLFLVVLPLFLILYVWQDVKGLYYRTGFRHIGFKVS